MSQTMIQFNEQEDPLTVPDRDVKPNKVYIRKELKASKNIFKKKAWNKAKTKKTMVDLTFGASNVPYDDSSACMAISKFNNDSIKNDSPKAFLTVLNSQVGNKLSPRSSKNVQTPKTVQGKFLGDDLKKISKEEKIKENNDCEISFMCDKTPKNFDKKEEKATFGETAAKHMATVGAIRYKKRQKINLFRSKNKRQFDRAVTTGVCQYGEFRFMKPRFLKSVTTVMAAKSLKVEIHLKNLADNHINSI